MITGFFLYLLYGFLSFVAGFLPVVAFPTEVSSGIQSAWYYVNGLSFLLPVSTLLTVLGLAMSFHVAVLLWRLGHLIASYLRGR